MSKKIYIECPLKECQFTITDSVNHQPSKLIYVKPVSIDELVKVDKTFWKRLYMFVENVQVSDMMSEEEKQYILNTAKNNRALMVDL